MFKNLLMSEVPENWVIEAYKKYIGLRMNRGIISTLVVGSSHGYYGFHPENDEYNLCFASQDLYYACHLYEKNANMPLLKNIILFYSVFSRGYVLEKTSEKLRSVLYNFFWKIPYYKGTCFNFWKAKNFIKNKVKNLKQKVKVPTEYRGECLYDWFFPSDINVEKRALTHLKLNLMESQNALLLRMAKLAKEKQHNLVVVIPPCRSDYKLNLLAHKDLFLPLYELKNIKILNFFEDSDFNDKDFGDSDHLNLRGAQKLTLKIRNWIDLQSRGGVTNILNLWLYIVFEKRTLR